MALPEPHARQNDIEGAQSFMENGEDVQSGHTDNLDTLTRNRNRFSLAKFRTASDSALAWTFRSQKPNGDIVPNNLTPTVQSSSQSALSQDKSTKRKTFMRFRKERPDSFRPKSSSQVQRLNFADEQQSPTSLSTQDLIAAERLRPQSLHNTLDYPLPAFPRFSESSRSDVSSSDRSILAGVTTTTTVSTTTTSFFKLPRRRKHAKSLFPLPPKITTSGPNPDGLYSDSETRLRPAPILTARNGTISGQESPRRSGNYSPAIPSGLGPDSRDSRTRSRSDSQRFGRALSSSRLSKGSYNGLLQIHQDPTSLMKRRSTQGSESARTSVSLSQRPSLAQLLSLKSPKQSEDNMRRTNTGFAGSNTPRSFDSRSMASGYVQKQPIVIPEKCEGDTPARYLARLEEIVSPDSLISVLSRYTDDFSQSVLRSCMRRFAFFEEPLDMAIRKLLMQIELPKETQHIDRSLQAFADRYHECNPGIFKSPDEAYFVAFSILILHTDVFNKNNKQKMTKSDYVRNARSQSIPTEVLSCFYDNICYTPFIQVEDDSGVAAERIAAQSPVQSPSMKSGTSINLLKRNVNVVDPYLLILEGRLNTLRPSLEDVMQLHDSFSLHIADFENDYVGLNRAFAQASIVQILSSRSRPEAFRDQVDVHNAHASQVGLVDMKAVKVGILWRKDSKKKKTRSPWQEWGAILTASQLYLFKNPTWVRNLMHQYESHKKAGKYSQDLIFRPPVEQFKPNFLLSTESLVAVVDNDYKKHKHAFVIAQGNDFQEFFLAENTLELHDWLMKMNYAAAFRSAGVRMRLVTSSTASISTSVRPDFSDPSLRSLNAGTDEATASQQLSEARYQILSQRLDTNLKNLAELEKEIQNALRVCAHLKILTPLQTKTRSDLVHAAQVISLRLRNLRLGKWRFACYDTIFRADLDYKSTVGIRQPDKSTAVISHDHNTSAQGRRELLSLPRRVARNVSGSRLSVPKHHKSRSTSATSQLFGVDELFKSSTNSSMHKAKGSWELPPLQFETQSPSHFDDRGHVDSSDGSPEAIFKPQTPDPAYEENRLDHPGYFKSTSSLELAPTTGGRRQSSESDNSTISASGAASQIGQQHVTSKPRSKPDVNDAKNAQADVEPSRSVELEPSRAGEVLMRTHGSFTIHGKKASIVDFGKGWQDLTSQESNRVKGQDLPIKNTLQQELPDL